jgi:oxygen-dependent protoporphyrinogen oxidase
MQTLPDALRQRLGKPVCLNTPVQQLTPTLNGWDVTVKEQRQHVDALVYTAPLYHLSTMGLPSTAEVQALADVQYTPISILVLGYRREQIGHPLDGFGMLVPAVEPCNIFGTLFSSSMFSGRAPDGHVTLTVFIGGARQPALASEPSAALLEVAQQDLHRLLGVAGEPTYMNHIFWPKAVPQYELGYGHKQAMIARLERQYPGFFMAGSYRQGVAVGDTLASGYEAAERLISYLDHRGVKVG